LAASPWITRRTLSARATSIRPGGGLTVPPLIVISICCTFGPNADTEAEIDGTGVAMPVVDDALDDAGIAAGSSPPAQPATRHCE
jgi:hypothetical protein